VEPKSKSLFQDITGWAFQKDSPYLEVFNDRLRKMAEVGFLAKGTKDLVRCTGLGALLV